MRRISKSDVDKLIDAIYEAGADPERWQGVLDKALQHVDAHSGQLWSPLTPVEAGGLVFSRNIAESLRPQYLAHYWKHDLWNQRTVERGLVVQGSVYTEGRLTEEREWRASVIYNEFMRQQDIYRMCGGVVTDGREEFPFVALLGYRDANQVPFDKAETAFFQSLLPHLRRALKLRSRLSAAETTSPAEMALQALGIAALALDGNARVRFANTAAERLLSTHPAARLRHGCLRLAGSGEQRRLEELLRHSANRMRDLAPQAPTTITVGQLPGPRLILSFVPAMQGALNGGGEVVALVFLRSAGDASSLTRRELQAAYGLSNAEADLVLALTSGASLQEHATERGVAHSTVRTQLNQAMAKIGVSRQSDLVRTVLTGHLPIIGNPPAADA